MGLVRFIVVAETDRDALTIARRAYLRWRSSFVYLSAMHGALPDSPLNVESFDQLIGQGQAIAGSVDTVCAFLRKQIEISEANYLVGQFCFGDLPLDDILRSVELFAMDVMPKLQTA
jgi:alkanesulfonate monooxygenase SsuD/methylene tetrahydromethanopterin reductase-like flavin-dependent oxidoreductase (luciferase family)